MEKRRLEAEARQAEMELERQRPPPPPPVEVPQPAPLSVRAALGFPDHQQDPFGSEPDLTQAEPAAHANGPPVDEERPSEVHVAPVCVFAHRTSCCSPFFSPPFLFFTLHKLRACAAHSILKLLSASCGAVRARQNVVEGPPPAESHLQKCCNSSAGVRLCMRNPWPKFCKHLTCASCFCPTSLEIRMGAT